jgi:hypothetical protein
MLGEELGPTDGVAEGEALREDELGFRDGLVEGEALGEALGLEEGFADGEMLEEELGLAEGVTEGTSLAHFNYCKLDRENSGSITALFMLHLAPRMTSPTSEHHFTFTHGTNEFCTSLW